MPKKRITKDRSTDIGPKTRNHVECNCTLHCNGSKWVDPRTFEKHWQEMERLRTITSVPQSTSQSRRSMSSLVDVGSSSTSKRRRKQEAEEEEEEEEESQDSSNSSYSDDDESNQTDYQEPINILTKRKRYSKFRQTELIPDDENLNNDSDDNGSSDDNGGGSDDNGGLGDNDGLNDNDDDDSYNEDFDDNETYINDDDRAFSNDDVP